jgi:hypothetical protein
MKKIFFCILLLAVSCVGAYAQDAPCANMAAGQQPMPQGQAGGMMKGDMMQMCEPMMKHMMGQAIMTRDMLQLVKEVIQVEQKIVKGLNARERKQALADLDEKLKRIDRMMDDMRKGMMQGPPPATAPQAGAPQQAVPGHAH